MTIYATIRIKVRRLGVTIRLLGETAFIRLSIAMPWQDINVYADSFFFEMELKLP
jgi:hypothetical protein